MKLLPVLAFLYFALPSEVHKITSSEPSLYFANLLNFPFQVSKTIVETKLAEQPIYVHQNKAIRVKIPRLKEEVGSDLFTIESIEKFDEPINFRFSFTGLDFISTSRKGNDRKNREIECNMQGQNVQFSYLSVDSAASEWSNQLRTKEENGIIAVFEGNGISFSWTRFNLLRKTLLELDGIEDFYMSALSNTIMVRTGKKMNLYSYNLTSNLNLVQTNEITVESIRIDSSIDYDNYFLAVVSEKGTVDVYLLESKDLVHSFSNFIDESQEFTLNAQSLKIYKSILYINVAGYGIVAFNLNNGLQLKWSFLHPSIIEIKVYETQAVAYLEVFFDNSVNELFADFLITSDVPTFNRVFTYERQLSNYTHTHDKVFHYIFVDNQKIIFFRRGVVFKIDQLVYIVSSFCSKNCRLLKVIDTGINLMSIVVTKEGGANLLFDLSVNSEELICVFTEEGVYKMVLTADTDRCGREIEGLCVLKKTIEFEVVGENRNDNSTLLIVIFCGVFLVNSIGFGYLMCTTRCCMKKPALMKRNNKIGEMKQEEDDDEGGEYGFGNRR